MKKSIKLAVALAGSLFAISAFSQSFPDRPIKLIVPFPPGGVTDIVARTLSVKLTDELKQPVVVENRAGASGAIGAEAAARSAPDGYTWLMGNISTLAINQWTMAKLGYNPSKNFEPVAMVAVQPLLVVVNQNVPVNSLSELVAYAKNNPGKLNYGTAGSSIHLAVEYFSGLAGIKMNHIPYKGSAPAITDLLGGQVQVLFDPFSSIHPQVASGKVKALGISTANRSAIVPNVPTVIESGFAGYDVSSWQGIVVPTGTPKEIVNKMNAAINKVLQSKEIEDRFAQFSAVPTRWTPQQFGDYISQEQKRWETVAKNAGVKPE
ncbi:tripartite tricarboxylate transporter substrate binding protein [Zwartia sp.]|uniref:Bug family tripartite tricarboxylate transporter substrate binding protein n=1 Tax=Zwartia sp. TaxID=2978004 RepID=UPI00272686A1|nr:tripartite tricarboxylate transporter substrate binding protein [Zwartia sp.]MDO9026134.1 tripartite tricarboxylate transporter substrate binding protein [Zwartia sp.]